MEELFQFLGVILTVPALLFGGALIQDSIRDTSCKNGKPVVIEGKVYRCVASK